jgi:hypothetical protein
MLLAPEWGDAALADREKAPRRQPEGPSNFSSVQSGYSAASPENQEQLIKGPVYGADGTKVLRNVGQLKKVIKRVVALLKLRYGARGCPKDHATDIYRVVAAVEIAAEALDQRFVRDRHNWSARHLRNLPQRAREEVDFELRRHPVEITQRWIGEQLGLTAAERAAIKLYDAEAIDVDADTVVLLKKARAAQLARERRERKEGATPRSRCRARQRELQPEVATATWYRSNPSS